MRLGLQFRIVVHGNDLFMKVVEPEIWNALLKDFDGFLVRLGSVEHTFQNMGFPSSSQDEIGYKWYQSINWGNCSSHFWDLCCETHVRDFIDSYQVINFIQNSDYSIYSFFKYELLDVYILIVDKICKSDWVQQVFTNWRLTSY